MNNPEHSQTSQYKASATGGTGQGLTSATEDRALALLGSGISAESVASALGVSPSRISQLLANETFAAQVAELRFNNLQSHNIRDGSYDSLEDRLISKLERSMNMMVRPMEILKAIQVVNGARRRGQSAPEQVSASQTIVNLMLPTQITQRFITNGDNQVVSAGEQNLVTMQASRLLNNLESKESKQPKQLKQENTPAISKQESEHDKESKSPTSGAPNKDIVSNG